MRVQVRCRWKQFQFALLVSAVSIVSSAGNSLLAQTAQTTDSPPGLTFSVQSRLVAEDVLVTDAQGKPVHGLPQSVFHIYDNGKPQVIRSFEEGMAEAAETKTHPAPPLPPGVFSNISVADAHAASEVLLVDTDDMVLDDQMYLLAQLKTAISTLPPNVPAALFCSTNGRPVQLRGLTTDHEDLRRALSECLPVLNHAIDDHFASAVEQLLTVSAFLQQAPGRKNILWFVGDFPLSLVPANEQQQPGRINPNFATRQHFVRLVEEALAEARVSVYPVDVRGVITANLAPPANSAGAQSQARNPSSVMQRTPVVTGPPADGPAEQRQQMTQLASSTGGKAFVLNNIAEEVTDAFDLGTHAYVLTYLPTDYITDETWHRITITVDGDYHLSYRNGYLATWSGVPGGRQGFRLEDGRRVDTSLEPNRFSSEPIRFTVKLAPESAGAQPAKKGRFRLALSFRIPTDQVSFVHKDDLWKNQLLICSYAYSSDGKMRGGKLQELDTALTDDQWQRAHRQELPVEQVIDVPGDAGYLLLAVRDKRTQRIGTFFLPMRAVRALPPGSSAPVPQQSSQFPAQKAPAPGSAPADPI